MIENVPSGFKQVEFLPHHSIEVEEQYLEGFFDFMFERHQIWYKRTILKQPRPWTIAPILDQAKFTNVYRELDRSSQFLINNILLNKDLSNKDKMFQIFVYRFFNLPDAFIHNKFKIDLPFYNNFDCVKIHKQTVNYRVNVGNPWQTAYMMNVLSVKKSVDWQPKWQGGLFKDFAYCEYVFTQFHKIIPDLEAKLKQKFFKTPKQFCKYLERLPATSAFTSHEFFLDFCLLVKYCDFKYFPFNENDYTNVSNGLGSSVALRFIFPSLLMKNQVKGVYVLKDIAEQKLAERGVFQYLNWDGKNYKTQNRFNLTLHQIEFTLCEYSKYLKMKLQIGKQRGSFIQKTFD